MSWQRIRGHDALIAEFAQIQRRGRLAHAYLFVGPAGVGKKHFALELAKTLLCENAAAAGAGSWQACDRCAACRLVAAGTHPDVIEAGRPPDKNEVPIEVVRTLCQALGLKAARGRVKIAILDDADDLNVHSANCFLKTLEEPPPGSLLILIATSTSTQLPTIVSRCQVTRFAPLPAPVIADLLRAQGIEDAALIERAVRQSGGSPGHALALAEPALWQFRRQLVEALARPAIDSVALAQQWLEFVEQAGKESAGQRRRTSLSLRLLTDFLNNALRVSVGAAPRTPEPEDLPALQAVANRLAPEAIEDLIDRTMEAEHQVGRYAQLVLAIEALADALGQGMTVGR